MDSRCGLHANAHCVMMSYSDPHAETPQGEPGPAHPIALADVIGLKVSSHWTEAVAVVEGLCAAILADSTAVAIVPDLADVVITSHGTLMIRKGARGTRDVDEVGRVLHALLNSDSTPLPLRLFAAEAIGSGRYPTVEAYAEALAYYARPNRAELIRSLYARCLAVPLELPPADERLQPEAPAAAEPRRVRWAVAAAVLAVGVAAAGAAVWAWGQDDRVASSVTALRDAIQAAAGDVRVRLGVPGVESAPPLEAGTDTVAPAPARPRRAAPPALDAATSDWRADAAGLLPPTLFGPPGAMVEGGLAVPPALPTPMPAVSPAMDADLTVYTSASEGIEPPVMRTPKLPPMPVVQPQAAGTNTMELIIDRSGQVERVRLVSIPVRMQDMTLLSAAKVWTFYPALKDGKPVRYRLTLSWIVSPR